MIALTDHRLSWGKAEAAAATLAFKLTSGIKDAAFVLTPATLP